MKFGARWIPGPEIKTNSCSAEHEILYVHKYINIKNFSYHFWHFNLYKQEKFHAQLSMKFFGSLLEHQDRYKFFIRS